MNALSLCSGIGGLDLGLSLAIEDYRTVCWVEGEPFCQKVLLARMADGVLDRAPIWGDLRTFDARGWRGVVDCVVAGFPCQPFSVAGKRKGATDTRNLWPDVRRVIIESESATVFLENVPGSLPYFYHVVLPELSGLDYRTATGLFTAAEVGAPHRRQRLFILAHRNNEHGNGRGHTGAGWRAESSDSGIRVGHADEPPEDARATASRSWNPTSAPDCPMGHPDDPRLEGRSEPERDSAYELPPWPPSPEERDRWAAVLARWPDLAPAISNAPRSGQLRAEQSEDRGAGARGSSADDADEVLPRPEGRLAEAQPPLRRMADGAAHRVDRLKALGNAVVPSVAALSWHTLSAALAAGKGEKG